METVNGDGSVGEEGGKIGMGGGEGKMRAETERKRRENGIIEGRRGKGREGRRDRGDEEAIRSGLRRRNGANKRSTHPNTGCRNTWR